MIVASFWSWGLVFRLTWIRMLSLALVSVLVSVAQYQWEISLSLSDLPANILGVALSFLIGFRVNAAYERWWEGFQLWESIHNDSRNLGRQFSSFISADFGDNNRPEYAKTQIQQLVRRQIAFGYSLNAQLRQLSVMDAVRTFLNEDEAKQLAQSHHIPKSLLELQSQQLQKLRNQRYTDDNRCMQIDDRLVSLTEAMGGCERIKNTVFPRAYAYYTSLFVLIFSFMVPFILVDKIGFLTAPASLIIGFIFYGLDNVAKGIENPFQNRFNDVPMNAICREIERDLLHTLGETNLPEPLQAQGGFLY